MNKTSLAGERGGNNLSAPGRMDVVEQILSSDPFFKQKVIESGNATFTNRRGATKQYSRLTVELVSALAQARLDAVTMRRDAVIAKAFEYMDRKGELAVTA